MIKSISFIELKILMQPGYLQWVCQPQYVF